jgi:hypothetical protein
LMRRNSQYAVLGSSRLIIWSPVVDRFRLSHGTSRVFVASWLIFRLLTRLPVWLLCVPWLYGAAYRVRDTSDVAPSLFCPAKVRPWRVWRRAVAFKRWKERAPWVCFRYPKAKTYKRDFALFRFFFL